MDIPAQDYFDKARRAEEYALQADDIVTKNTWLRIAASYRDLAKFVRKRSAKGLSWGEPLSPPDLSAKGGKEN
jgi:hypothetical protein